jgi:hypothetical protein
MPFLLQAQPHHQLQSDPEYKRDYLKTIEENAHKVLRTYDNAYKKEVRDMVRASLKLQKERVEDDFYFFHKETLDYLYSLLEKVQEANPEIDLSAVRFALARDPIPNAYAMVNGSITYNVGIFPNYKQESHIVAIMCHELIHYLNNHLIIGLNTRLDKINSKEFKEEIKAIEKSKYNRVTKARKFIFEEGSSHRSFSREHEHEADITGLSLYLNTDYPPEEFVEGIAQLDHFTMKLDSTRIPVFELLEMDPIDDPSTTGVRFEDTEREERFKKLKTHPDVPVRVDSLKSILSSKEISASKNADYDTTDFARFRHMMLFENCESYMYIERYDYALLYSVRLKRHYPDSKYLDAIIAYSYYKLFEARKTHQLGTVAGHPGGHSDSSYNELLLSFYFGRIRTLENALYEFCKKWDDEDQQEERFLIAFGKVADIRSDQKTLEILRKRYAQTAVSEEQVKLFPNFK